MATVVQTFHLTGDLMHKAGRIAVGAGAAGAMLMISALPAQAASDFAYMEALNGTQLTVLATSGDTIGGVMWPGTPDGIGVLKAADGKITVFVNHEFSSSDAVAKTVSRANGAAAGATVSAVNLNGDATGVTAFRDVVSSVKFWDYATKSYGSTPTAPTGAAALDSYGGAQHSKVLNRFCSSSMAQPGDFAAKVTGKDGKVTTYGYTGAVYLTGEEGGDESRGFAMNNEGELVQIPRFGLAGWETFVNSPTSGRTTVIMGNEDNSATNSQLWMYVGEKTTSGTWYEKAGLTNGQAYVASVVDAPTDAAYRTKYGKGSGAIVNFNPIDTTANGVAQNAAAMSVGTALSRVEDGSFDPMNPNDYYFVTTESNKNAGATKPNPAEPTISRDGGALWRLRFADVSKPLNGAILTMLLDGSEAPYLSKPDNITVDKSGNVLIQEDPGGNDHVARMVSYRISDGKVGQVAKFKDVYFAKGGAQFITNDEESSGVTDVTDFLRKGASDKNSYYLLDAQVHAPISAARPDLTAAQKASLSTAIEGGQLLLLTIPQSAWATIYAS